MWELVSQDKLVTTLQELQDVHLHILGLHWQHCADSGLSGIMYERWLAKPTHCCSNTQHTCSLPSQAQASQIPRVIRGHCFHLVLLTSTHTPIPEPYKGQAHSQDSGINTTLHSQWTLMEVHTISSSVYIGLTGSGMNTFTMIFQGGGFSPLKMLAPPSPPVIHRLCGFAHTFIPQPDIFCSVNLLPTPVTAFLKKKKKNTGFSR